MVQCLRWQQVSGLHVTAHPLLRLTYRAVTPVVVIVGQEHCPASHLVTAMVGASEVLQCGMVSDNGEFCATDIVVEFLAAIHNSKKLAFGAAVLVFSVTATLTRICDNMVFCIFMFFLKYRRNSKRGIVSCKHSRPIWLRQLQNRCRTKLSF